MDTRRLIRSVRRTAGAWRGLWLTVLRIFRVVLRLALTSFSSGTKNAMRENDFTVEFGRVGWTLEYEDAQGQLTFTYDIGSGGSKSLCLEHYSPQAQRVPGYRLAFERTKEFLESCGYQVEVFGAFALAQTTTAADVAAQIQAELASRPLPQAFPSDIRACLATPTRSEFKLHPENTVWDMWVVFEEPVHGLRIVFDEHSRQFGIAERDVFLGFYGTFLQTLDAISKVA